MPKKMFISAARPNEVRGAIVDEAGKLEAYELEMADARLLRGNIYVGQVANTEPSLNAAFIDFGSPKQGFLPVGDVCSQAYHQKPKSEGRVKINEVLRRRRKILVQVVKDAIGNKGAALTTEISLPGRYVVFTPFDSGVGISRKIEEESERKRLKGIINDLDLPKGAGLIVRTSAEGASSDELSTDIARLAEQWEALYERSKQRRTKSGTCLYKDNDLVIRMLRDQYRSDIGRVLLDTRAGYDAAVGYFEGVMPERVEVLEYWSSPKGLFSSHGLESQVAEIYERKVRLPSGGYLIIEPTEALIVVDVNSGKSTSQSSQAETALATNLEAAEELARQLRLRDLGGLVVVDFIDMASRSHNRKVERQLKNALKVDRARTYIGSISENGLMEINRQRIKQAVRLQTHESCPTCGGSGLVRGSRFAAVSVLRTIEERAAKGRLRDVRVEMHSDLANELQNSYRRELHELEKRYEIRIVIQGLPNLKLTDENIVWNEGPSRQSDQSSSRRGRRKSDESKDEGDDKGDKAEAESSSDSDKGKRGKSSRGSKRSRRSRSGRRRRRRRRRSRRSRKRSSRSSQKKANDGKAQGKSDGGAKANKAKGDGKDRSSSKGQDDSSGASGDNEKTGSDNKRDDDKAKKFGGSGKRRSRRRSRGRGKSGGQEQTGGDATSSKSGSDGQSKAGSSDASQGGAGDSASASSESNDSKKSGSSKRRRRRRRSSRKDSDQGSDQSGEAKAESSDKGDGNSSGRRRRRRRSSKKDTSNPGAQPSS